jgi:hypothetical protein
LIPVTLEATGADRAAAVLEGVGEQIADFRPAWRQLVPEVRRATGRAFATAGGSLGARWQRLSLATIAKKGSSTPGVDTGGLLAEVTSDRAVLSLTRDGFEYGTREKRGVIFGADVRGKQPARPFLGWTDPLADKGLAAVDGHVGAVLDRAQAELGS